MYIEKALRYSQGGSFGTERIALGIEQGLLNIHPPVTLATPPAAAQRCVIYLEPMLLDRTNTPVGDWVDITAVVIAAMSRDVEEKFVRGSRHATSGRDFDPTQLRIATPAWGNFGRGFALTHIQPVSSLKNISNSGIFFGAIRCG